MIDESAVTDQDVPPGPLHGVRIVEVAGIGPGPLAGMMLADAGADIVRVERPGGNPAAIGHDVLFRSRRSVAVDLKRDAGVEVALKLVESADALFEGYRPGVAERLGIGPEPCLARNPRLVYGRMTGWGQDGPLAHRAGHDIDYIALSGALHAIGRRGQPPTVPLNLVGDFGGGGMLLAYGMVCAILEARTSGRGQVVDAAMVDGSAALMAMVYDLHAAGLHTDERGTNLLDTGAPFYDVYETADGEHIALGPLEPPFYAELVRVLELGDDFEPQHDRDAWPRRRRRVAEVVASRTRDEWDARLADTDVCYAPVLSLAEAPRHPHNRARGTFVEVAGVVQPAPAPRFSRTPSSVPVARRPPGADTRAVLAEAGYDSDDVDRLMAAGVVAEP
jgi:alpha-methylacyl-CoA racemase